jgi:hypothetical protein
VVALLNVQACVRWASGQPDETVIGETSFTRVPMLLALSVTDINGAAVEQLNEDAVHVGFQAQPEAVEGSLAVVSDFHHNGPTFRGLGWYSCILNPPDSGIWIQDEIFICVTVLHQGPGGLDKGKTITLARYHQIL